MAESFANIHRLKPRYLWLTTLVGLVGCLAGIGLMCGAFVALARLFGIDWDGPLLRQDNGGLCLVAIFLAMPITIYLGCAFVAGTLGAVMVGLKKMNASEAIRYALFSQHPQSWRRTTWQEPPPPPQRSR